MPKTIDESVQAAFIEIVKTGKFDPVDVADSMGRLAALVQENIRGARATSAGLVTAAAIFLRRAQDRTADDGSGLH
jgi:hypothetical protein